MTTELKSVWIQSLQDRPDLFGKDYLNNNGKLCPLGCLAQIMVDRGLAKWVFRCGHESAKYIMDLATAESDLHYIPASLRAHLGLPCIRQHQIATINDASDSYLPSIEYINQHL